MGNGLRAKGRRRTAFFNIFRKRTKARVSSFDGHEREWSKNTLGRLLAASQTSVKRRGLRHRRIWLVNQEKTQTPRRLDIQILRGVAVLGVMLAHFGALLPGGFLGVDVFFVISGFVITLSIWYSHLKTSSTSAFLIGFWRRRFFRLVPVLLVVLAITLLAASVTLPPKDFGDQVEMTVWSLFFAGNIGVEVLTTGDYFDPGAEENWLLHLWSLGVEEQFYLVFPFIFLAFIASSWAQRHTGRPLLAVGLLAAFSFVLSLLNDADASLGWGGIFTESTGFSALFGYYSPVTRAWQFLLGVLAALLVVRGGTRNHRWISLGSAGALLLSFGFIAESNLLPGIPTVLPMLAVFLLLIFPLSARVSESRGLAPLRWLGDRSYSAYLWHWPIWLFVGHHLGSGLLGIALAFSLTLLFSAISYRFIELRFITRGKTQSEASFKGLRAPSGRRKENVVLAGLAGLPLLLGFGTVAIHENLQNRGVLRTAPPIEKINEQRDCLKTDCLDKNVEMLLIGDSHAGSLGDPLQKELEKEGVAMYGAIVARHFGCLHLPSITVTSIHEECQELSAQVRALVRDTEPSVVLLHGYTAGRFTEINSGGDSIIKLVDHETGDTVTEATGLAAYEKSLRNALDIVTESGAQVVIVSGVPDFSLRPEQVGRSGEPASIAELLFAPWLELEFGEEVTKDAFLSRHGPFLEVEKTIADMSHDVSLVEPWGYVCQPDFCSQSTPEGEYMYFDADHLTTVGATMLAEGVVDHIRSEGLLRASGASVEE